MSHLRRPTVSGTEPVQVTLKLQPGLPSLRSPALKACVKEALDAGQERFGMRLLRYMLDKDGLSLVVTAPHRRALSRGIQGVSVRIARAVNRRLERKGRLFADRYDARSTPDSAPGSTLDEPGVHAGAVRGKGSAGKTSAGKASEGKRSAGKVAAGKRSAGKVAAGKATAGKRSAGKVAAGKAASAKVPASKPATRKRSTRPAVMAASSRAAHRAAPVRARPGAAARA